MISNWFKKLKIEDKHPIEETLLAFADGELSDKEADKIRKHLENCWSCRAQLDEIQETITLFVNFRNQIQNPFAPPPNDCGKFDQQLAELAAETDIEKKSIPKRLGFWQKFQQLINLADWSPAQKQFSIGSIASLLIIALLWQLVGVRNISAGELLDKSTALQNEKINSTNQPVVYQKLKVRAANSKTLDWEVWNDAKNQRAKQVIGGSVPKESIDVLQELSEILQKNSMNPSKPMSPESFKAWHSSLANKTDEIVENESVTLHTKNNKITFEGQISEGTIQFRKDDFHPVAQTLKVKTNSGEKTFEISEVNFEVVSLNTLKPNFFDGTPVSNEIVKITKTETSPSPQTSESPEKSSSPSVENSPETAVNAAPKVGNPPKIVADANLEVEVLQLLSNVKADLGEEITIKIENGILYIRGLIDSTERKNEILNGLQSVRQNPAVRIELETVAEAVARQKNKPANKPTSIDNLETKSMVTAAQSELVQHFGNEAEARQFANKILNRTSRTLNYVYAMRRLAQQFSAAELKNLTPEARAKWLTLVTTHARNYKAESDGLAKELGTVFNAPNLSGSASVEVNSIDDLPRAIETLVSLASTNNRVITSALAVTADDNKFSALRSPQFWQSIRNAEILAAKIAAIK